MNKHQQEVTEGRRFEFGANWMGFLSVLNDNRIWDFCERLDSLSRIQRKIERVLPLAEQFL